MIRNAVSIFLRTHNHIYETQNRSQVIHIEYNKHSHLHDKWAERDTFNAELNSCRVLKTCAWGRRRDDANPATVWRRRGVCECNNHKVKTQMCAFHRYLLLLCWQYQTHVTDMDASVVMWLHNGAYRRFKHT